MYPAMGKTAGEEGYPELAEWFETLAKAEKSHAGCACGSSGAAACGPGGLTAWERGRRDGGARARRALMSTTP
jgi:hypothetical protein